MSLGEHRTNWTFRIVDSLEKVLPDADPRPAQAGANPAGFLGETLSFQLAYLPPSAQNSGQIPRIKVTAEGPLSDQVQLSTVELVPATLLAFDGHDDGYLADTPGLYPDVLRPLDPGAILKPQLGYWQAIWADVTVEDETLAGEHPLTITVTNSRTGEVLHTAELTVTIHGTHLPPLDIINTHWMHVDCLADHYQVEAFSEPHWRIIDQYVASLAAMRGNSILTPTWTPPLDTAVGHRRTPVQLIRISDDGAQFHFDFSRLGRWIDICSRHGIETLEIAHLFTQWGAKATPAVYIETEQGVDMAFGWHVAATDPSYRRLMEQLLPALQAYLAENWSGQVLYHISDEPNTDNLEFYRDAREVVADLLEGEIVADALSHLEFVRQGVVQTPIVATNHVKPFLEAGINPWVYYCVSQNRDVANRFISMPSLRNRVLGRQLFVGKAPGFLHWGYNFWRTQNSLTAVDPFTDNSAGGAFPAGDPFIVYPDADGSPLLSLRHRVFAQAMEDHRALQLLRKLTDHETAASYVNQEGQLAYDAFSYDAEHYIASRRAVDDRIVEELAAQAAS